MYITKTTIMKTTTKGFIFNFQRGGECPPPPKEGGHKGSCAGGGEGSSENVRGLKKREFLKSNAISK